MCMPIHSQIFIQVNTGGGGEGGSTPSYKYVYELWTSNYNYSTLPMFRYVHSIKFRQKHRSNSKSSSSENLECAEDYLIAANID